MPENYYKYELIPLPYAYDALEPYIDTETMQIHHNRHLKTYVDNLNKALEDSPKLQKLSLEQLLKYPSEIPVSKRKPVLNNAGGVYNHNFFFKTLRPGTLNNKPVRSLSYEIEIHFGSFEQFQSKFKEQALAVFGSGYLWLVRNRKGALMLFPTANQDSPISYGYCPILSIDVWEHAYYLKHKNLRGDYINDWWNVVNWEQAEKNYQNCYFPRKMNLDD